MNHKKFDYTFYTTFIVSLLILFLIIFYVLFLYKYVSIPECFIYKNFKIYCPACGCTRAILCLLKGNFLKSIYYNPSIVYFSIIVFLYLIFKFIKFENSILVKHIHLFFYVGIFILLFNCILRNIFMIIFKIYI